MGELNKSFFFCESGVLIFSGKAIEAVAIELKLQFQMLSLGTIFYLLFFLCHHKSLDTMSEFI